MATEREWKIAVVDDIEQDRVQIAEQTRDILNHAQIPHCIDLYADGQSLLDEIRGGKRYSLLLLDVLMDEMDGMALARAVRDQGNDTMIVFISISQELCRRRYHVQAARYLDGSRQADRKTAIQVENTGNIDADIRLCFVAYWMDGSGNTVAAPSRMPAIVRTADWISGVRLISDAGFYFFLLPAADAGISGLP